MGRYFNGGHNKIKYCLDQMYYIKVKEFIKYLKTNKIYKLILYQKLHITVNKNYIFIDEYNQKIKINWQQCNYGGRRAFFICPGCNKNFSKLVYMMDNKFACRICNNANYKSSQESKKWVKISRLIKNLAKLNFSDNDNEIFDIKNIYKYSIFSVPLDVLVYTGIRRIKQIEKPKYMHFKTYKSIQNKCIKSLIDIYLYSFKIDKINKIDNYNNNIYNDIYKSFENCIDDFYKYNSPERQYNFYGKIQTHKTICNKNGTWIKRKEEKQQTQTI